MELSGELRLTITIDGAFGGRRADDASGSWRAHRNARIKYGSTVFKHVKQGAGRKA